MRYLYSRARWIRYYFKSCHQERSHRLFWGKSYRWKINKVLWWRRKFNWRHKSLDWWTKWSA